MEHVSTSSEEDDPKLETQRADSPVSSCVSMKSDKSMDPLQNFSSEPVSTDSKLETQRADSPVFSCVSMKSDKSMDPLQNFSSEPVSTDSKLETQRADSPVSSCVSMKSDRSMDPPQNFSSEPVSTDSKLEPQRADSPVSSCVSMKSDRSMDPLQNFSSEPVSTDSNSPQKKDICRDNLHNIFKELEQKIISLVKNELNRFKELLNSDSTTCNKRQDEDEQREGVLNITLQILRNMKHADIANRLQIKLAPTCHEKLKNKLRDKCHRINEGISGLGNVTLLNEIYTELYITEEGSGEYNQEHEVKQIEAASRKMTTQETPIKCNDIFKPLKEQTQSFRTALTKGIAGIGKTVSVQKFILDWAEGKANQDVLFMFPIPFRELNLMKEKKLSLVNLLHSFYPETKNLKPAHYKHYKIIFIFDGLDECRLPLNFQNNENLVDVEEQTSVDVLLTNLIKGNLLSSAHLWITSRPAAISQIPPEYIDQITEVRGFSDSQKQEYFRKRITDEGLANKVITHIKSSRSLYIMCHIPVFCWIAATVLERMLSKADSGEIPQTLTQMFTQFLTFQIKHKSQKYSGKSDVDSDQTRESILALGKLAFQQLEKGNIIFYEEDLRESGIDIREASVYSGVCTQIFRQEHELHLGKVFSFVHLSVQEFLAAVYVFFCFINIKDLKEQTTEQQYTDVFKLSIKSTMADFLKSAVDSALQSKRGHLDLFLRFLLGLSLESNQNLLRCILTPTERTSCSNKNIVKYIKRKIKKNTSTETTINLFHCLNELNDPSLVQEVQKYLSRGVGFHLHMARFSSTQWSALAFVLLNSEQELDEFDLSMYVPSEECLLRLLPVVKASKRAGLASCNLGKKACEMLGSVLNQENSYLKEVDLSNNDLQDSVAELLSGLKSSNCKLQILRLNLCNLDENICENLGSVLNLENSLKELDLSNNDLKDSGVALLSSGLSSSHCKLQILRLSGCMVTEAGCSSLAAALISNPSHLKELDLTYNHPGESGVKLLLARNKDPQCTLEILRLEHGGNIRIKPGLKKYICKLTLDPNTANRSLSLCEGNRKVVCVRKQKSYPDHPERFAVYPQVMSRDRLTERCYWEAEWKKRVILALTYKTIGRTGDRGDCVYGQNEKSWSLFCSDDNYTVFHDKKSTPIPSPPPTCKRVGVYVDCQAGTLSFYSISSDTHTPTHLHTFNTEVTEPLYAGFHIYDPESSVSVCKTE